MDASMSGAPPAGSDTMQRKKRGPGLLIAIIVVVVVIIVVVGLGFGLGWFKTSTSSSDKGIGGCTLPSAGSLKGEGSSLVQPLMDQWSSSYWTGSVVTSYNPAGSSSGISAITLKVVDFGASDAPLNPAQRAAAPGVLEFPEAAGSVVPIYNLPGNLSLNFTGSVLAQIYDGQITTWNAPAIAAINPGVTLPSNNIQQVYRSGGSGTTFIFTSFLTLENNYWASHYGKNLSWPSGLPGTAESGNGGLTAYVGETTYAIGYVDLTYALQSSIKLGIGAVENPSLKFIKANVANTESALHDVIQTLPPGSASWYNVSFLNAPGPNDYPIASLTYLMVYQNLSAAYSSYTLSSAENLVDFMAWAIGPGQQWSPLLYYATLPSSVLSTDNATLASMTFGGSAIPVCIPTGGTPS